MHARARRLTDRLRSIYIYVFSLPASFVSSPPLQPAGDPARRRWPGWRRSARTACLSALSQEQPRLRGGSQGPQASQDLSRRRVRCETAAVLWDGLGAGGAARAATPDLGRRPSGRCVGCWAAPSILVKCPFDPHPPSRRPQPRRPVPRSSGRGRSPLRGGMDPPTSPAGVRGLFARGGQEGVNRALSRPLAPPPPTHSRTL